MAIDLREIYEQVIGVLTSLRYSLRIWDIIDILIIAFLIYRVLSIMQKTSASSVIKGLLILLAAAWIANFFNMNILTYLLRQVMQLGILVIVVLFQPEIRKLFEKMGTANFGGIFRKRRRYDNIEAVIQNVAESCVAMAENKTGALIVFERKVGLNDYAVTGVGIDAKASSDLIQSVFIENAPMHDGALIIREDRILAAACMLPLSTNYNLSKELGMRHRAGVGLSERSDAVVVLVSEQTGTISVAIDGMLKRNLDNDTLARLLISEVLLFNDSREMKRRAKYARQKVTSDD
ncbi:MAG: diadenylate cyclase CdaA [Oscillospiraceae bacterium]|nr:diadenylate cyclase CdaA [Oscillospiraceae bacterium]